MAVALERRRPGVEARRLAGGRVLSSWWLGWPFGGWSLLLPAALVVVADLAGTWSAFGERYGEWSWASAQPHQRMLVVGPVVATAAALRAASVTQRHGALTSATAARAGWPAARRHLAVMCTWWTLAHAVGLVPALLWTARHATSGGPDLLVIVYGLVAVSALTVLGWTAGVVMPSPLWLPIVPVAVFYALLIPGTQGDGLDATAVVQRDWPAVDQAENATLVAYRLLLLVVATVVLVALAVACAQHRGGRRPAGLRPATAALALPVLLFAVPIAHVPALYTVEARPPHVCATAVVPSAHASIPVCVHPGHRGDLAALVRATAALTTAAGTPLVSSVQDVAVDRAGLAGGSLPRAGDSPVVLVTPSFDASVADGSLAAIASTMSGFDRCTTRGDAARTPAAQARTQLALDLQNWLLGAAGYSSGDTVVSDSGPAGEEVTDAAITGPFAHLSMAQVRAWIIAHRAGVMACSAPAPGARGGS